MTPDIDNIEEIFLHIKQLKEEQDSYVENNQISKNPDNDKVGEAITDTLMDMAVYSLIAICLFEEQNQKKGEN